MFMSSLKVNFESWSFGTSPLYFYICLSIWVKAVIWRGTPLSSGRQPVMPLLEDLWICQVLIHHCYISLYLWKKTSTENTKENACLWHMHCKILSSSSQASLSSMEQSHISNVHIKSQLVERLSGWHPGYRPRGVWHGPDYISLWGLGIHFHSELQLQSRHAESPLNPKGANVHLASQLESVSIASNLLLAP